MKVDLAPGFASWTFPGPLDDWLSALPQIAGSAIANAIDAEGAAIEGQALTAPAHTIAAWPEAACTALGLPPNTPLALDIRLSGSMGRPGATIVVRWLQPGRTVPARDVERSGLWLTSEGKKYRIPDPLFGVLELVDEFNRVPQATLDEHFRIWVRIRDALGDEQAATLTDTFLRSLRVVTASSMTFGISTDENGDVQLDPVLLADRRATEGEQLEHVRALTEADEAMFPKRLDQLREGAPAFPIGQGTYVVVEKPLQDALSAIRRLRKAPPEQRKRAAMYPDAVIRELLGQAEDAPSVFVETERFADRVRDIGEWAAPVLPWIKIPPQDWGAPTTGGVRVGGEDIPLEPEVLDAAVQSMTEAVAAGRPTIDVGGKSIPASAANLSALQQLQRALQDRADGKAPKDCESMGSTQVLIIETNLDETSFNRVCTERRAGTPGLPDGLRTSPKPHQEVGIRWLQQHWISGSKGAMLCDDMGLGKTFHALAFCLWLRALMESNKTARKPLLLVAPVGLLRNWEKEIQDHVMDPGLGTLVRAYGEHLRTLRRGHHLDGTAGLDTARLARGDVVLANYEAVSDYQLSFGAVPFAAVVLDEAQKIKSPKARMTHAVKGLNADFLVAMTGTPVENRLADLWCIADAVQPGALADLKEFSARFEVNGADVASLRSQVWQEESDQSLHTPRLLLRRLKTDKLEGLPRKHEHVIREPMPPRQLDAYERALAMKEVSGPEGMLGMIHALRRVSLHPVLMEGGPGAEELRVEESARMSATIKTLDDIASRDEKALVFLESLDLQDADQLPLLLKRRYGLKRLPMVINGEVGTEARQSRVDTFQKETGFDVMLLSPKAGGVGLTLTSANHVIHLSRWWNPAVEDQCSDRVYRIGQTRPVHIYYPLAILPGAEDASFDVQLQQLMDRKRQLAQNLLAAPAFTKEDYEALMQATTRRA